MSSTEGTNGAAARPEAARTGPGDADGRADARVHPAEPRPEDASARIDAAGVEAAAAEAVLLDPRCTAGAALPHLVLGWRHLLAARGLAVDEAGLAEALRAASLPGLAPERQAEAAAGVPELVDALRAVGVGRAGSGIARGTARRQAWLLRRAVQGARRAARPRGRRRRVGLGLAALVPLGLLAFFALGREGGGWRARYYAGLQLDHPALERIDPAVSFRWGRGAPAPGLPADGFSARWDACLDLDAATTLELVVGSDDGSRVFLDGEQVIDNWKRQPLHWKSREVKLAPGAHHLRVEYFDADAGATVDLVIRRPGHPPRTLRQRDLRPTTGEDDRCAS